MLDRSFLLCPRVAQRDVYFDGVAPQARSMLKLFF